jgi:hypothetical protein
MQQGGFGDGGLIATESIAVSTIVDRDDLNDLQGRAAGAVWRDSRPSACVGFP